jgi:N-formylglutamate amidohydrolase
LVSDWATAHGYLVEVNEPYAGAIVPATHLNDTQVYSIMLEVRRDVYMDEETGAKNNHFPILQAQISELLNTLASAEI